MVYKVGTEWKSLAVLAANTLGEGLAPRLQQLIYDAAQQQHANFTEVHNDLSLRLGYSNQTPTPYLLLAAQNERFP